jgi:hypothetical protein
MKQQGINKTCEGKKKKEKQNRGKFFLKPPSKLN